MTNVPPTLAEGFPRTPSTELAHAMSAEFVVGRATYRWTPWCMVVRALQEAVLPARPGLYRIRRRGRDDLDYIGQTGGSLRGRIRMLRGIYSQEMPYRDPHTAAPALWALLRQPGCEFEVSVLEVPGDEPWRKGLEAVAIALYRQHSGRSPNVNFGRMPPGYVMSSGNNARLVAAGRRFRGGLSKAASASHNPGIPPAGRFAGDPNSDGWGGHRWSKWLPLDETVQAPDGSGLYRIRGRGGVVYIGEGSIRARLEAHRRKTLDTMSSRPQHGVLRESGPLEFSAVIGQWQKHQRLELENDLIAAFVLEHGIVPAAQFIG